jgi:hypothetical protein
MTVEDFHHEFLQDVAARAESMGEFIETAFVEAFAENLCDAGEIDTCDRVQYADRGMRVDGYGGDPSENGDVLTLLIADFDHQAEIGSLTAADILSAFRKLSKFVQSVRDPEFRAGLEESAPVFGLADLIAARWSSLGQIRMVLVSNRRLATRMEGVKAETIGNISASHSVWDITRLHRYVASGREREELEINLLEQFGSGFPALPAHLKDADYEAYLAVIPGQQLAEIYDRWGARLLEQNVRCFLQFRSKVNKDIRNTISNQPDMFFAFNNGISATAERVLTRPTESGIEITALTNFQIVNGGQTTASIHAAHTDRRNPRNLSNVFVQMKLSIVKPEHAGEVVPRISEYANSQNKVSAADFFSNHPFHVRIENFSRRMFTAPRDGSFVQSKWFYERARGQYQDARAGLSTSERRKFDIEYPRRQMFTKTDMAKFLWVWEGKPHVVSMGAQKNFADFAAAVGREWEKDNEQFNEGYYKQLVAKAIVFRFMEGLVPQQHWYEGGYRANVVAYGIAKLAQDLGSKGKHIDFEAVWKAQDVPPGLKHALTTAAEAAHSVITNPPAGVRNVTEWAKKPGCWERLREVQVVWPAATWTCTIRQAEVLASVKAAKRTQRLVSGLEAQMIVVGAGAEFWTDVRTWAVDNGQLSPKEREILLVACRMPAMLPSDKQSEVILDCFARLQQEGCPMVLTKPSIDVV